MAGVVLLLAGALVGCSTGEIGAPMGMGSNNSSGTGTTGGSTGGGPTGSGTTGGTSSGTAGGANPGTSMPCVASASFAPPRLWRLNDQQFANVVHDVFGAGVTVPAEVSEAASVGSEEPSTDSLTIADNTRVHNYMSTAETVAQGAVQNLTALLGCSTSDATCVETFIRNKVARAFRRPLADAEVTDLLALYQVGAADSPSVGVETVLEYVMQSPYFLWRTELGQPAASAGTSMQTPLAPFELASALGFMFFDSVPDDALWAKAASGTLTQPDVEASEVDRLMALPAAQARIAGLVGSWLSIHKIEATVKDSTAFPQFNTTVRDDLLQSSQMFLKDVVLSGTITDLITSPKIYLNESLATIYGIGGVSGTALTAVNAMLPEWTGGILTQPAILAANDARPSTTDVVHRGLFVYNSMICGASIPGPPANAAAVNASLPETATERDRANFRDSNPMCLTCHGLFDPLGLLSERYDAIGRYSEYDAAHMLIDQTSTISVGDPALDGHADGLLDLASRLKSTRKFPDCAAGNLVNIAVGRIASADNACALQNVRDKFAENGSFTELVRMVATSPAFLTRDATLQ